MIINVVSTDRELHRQVEGALHGLPGTAPAVRFGWHDEDQLKSDFYIWDFQPDQEFPSWLIEGNVSHHLFVLDRKNLTAFRQVMPLADPLILLKPVMTAPLRAILVHAMASQRPGKPPSDAQQLESLRMERDEILECLIETNIKLQEYDQERTNFLARAIHDFRAPLTAISGYCGLLLASELGALGPEQREVLHRMQRSTQRLARMTSAMYELSLGTHVSAVRMAGETEIRSCIEQAAHEVGPVSDETGIEITLNIAPPTAPLAIDVSSLERVLVNLLENAAKFTPQGGLIEVRAYPFFWERRSVRDSIRRQEDRRAREDRSPNAYRVDVRDNGSGIPEEQLDKIFNEYTSYTGSRDRSGGGLGLAICRLILKQHHGTVWAENLSPAGAIFSFVLPMSPNDPLRVSKGHPVEERSRPQQDLICRR
jgi:signal transduction histidine kinase